MGIPAASGYPQYSGNLITPIFRMELLERWYCSTIYSDVSTTEYTGELNQGGDEIIFWREPKVMVRKYIKNQPIIHDTIDGEPVKMVIDQAYNFSIKINKIDQQQIQNWDNWKAGFLRSSGLELARTIDPLLLTEMWSSTSPFNQGANAGVKSGSVNLGTPGAPIVLTSANITQVLSFVHQVLDEACAPKEGRFVTLPPAGIAVLRNSDLRAAYLTGLSWSPLVNGRLPETVMGFTILESNYIPTVVDGGTGKLVYHLVAGVKMATAFAATIEDSRVITDKDDWADYYQGLSVFGFKVLYEDGLVHIYATFDDSP
jgi:hypothetical protein